MSNVNWNGNNSNLSKEISDYLANTSNKWDKAGAALGNNIANAEDTLLRALSIANSDEAAIKKLAKELGQLDANGQPKTNLEGLQTIARSRYERGQRAFAMLQNILSSGHQVMMQLIQSIRAR
jgi:hypothetical protein